MTTEIPAALARMMKGRCTHHGTDLRLVDYADQGLDDVLDAWQCPAIGTDPEIVAVRTREIELSKSHPVPWDSLPADVRAEREELHRKGREVNEKCRDSWVLLVPE